MALGTDLQRRIARHDAALDGVVVVGDLSTGRYCRPACPHRRPAARTVLLPTSAAARVAGLRRCLACSPYGWPLAPRWAEDDPLARRAMLLVVDGLVDREGVAGLAAALGRSARHVHRVLVDRAGAGPLALARQRRAECALVLARTTTLPLVAVARASGYRSERQCEADAKEMWGSSLRDLRPTARPGAPSGPSPWSTVSLSLPMRQPYAGASVLRHLALRAVPGVEEVTAGTYRRALRLPRGPAVLELVPRVTRVDAVLHLSDLADLTPALARARVLLDLDQDPVDVAAVLGLDAALQPLVRRAPGLRLPGLDDGVEMLVREVAGRGLPAPAQRRVVGRLAAQVGERLPGPVGRVTTLFPTAEQLAGADLAAALPEDRALAVGVLAAQVLARPVPLGPWSDREAVAQWVVGHLGLDESARVVLAARVLRDPGALDPEDPRLLLALRRLGLPSWGAQEVRRRAVRWRPHQAMAAVYLTSVVSHDTDGPGHP